MSADQPLTGDELATIKARAEAASPGPWEADLGSVWRPSPLSVVEIVCDCRGGEHVTTREDAEHIAGMDPATTLRLVAEIERLQALVDDEDSGGSYEAFQIKFPGAGDHPPIVAS